ncbi:TIGR03943 family putative permease subunit [Neobacillus ginsengisoli]|uniref:Membrane protein n=1 Tax=Neobacillus ginsengisoli TaxID=904295 RepID=A0ABT9XWS8_9BACI|nr:TIGR03943 family protein [Neobacillus ginsengisoli]MDQ0199786.1 putative membrane protein [Neobacillus ginsengisoli]
MEQEKGKINHIFIRGVILIGFTLLLVRLIIAGDLKYFIAPKMAPLSYFSLAAFLLMGIGQFWRNRNKNDEVDCDCGSDHGTSFSRKKSILTYSMFIIPILTGMFFSTNTLDSAVAGKRGVNFGEKTSNINDNSLNTTQNSNTANQQLNSSTNQSNPNDPNLNGNQTPRNVKPTGNTNNSLSKYDLLEKELLSSKKIIVNDDNFIFTMNTIEQKLDKFIGKEIELKGFVYKQGVPKNQIVIARFGVTCCVADSDIVGMLSSGSVSNVIEDEWVKVDGIIEKSTYQGSVLPSLKIVKIEKVPRLRDPYVYFK